jgi:hypothetical protein
VAYLQSIQRIYHVIVLTETWLNDRSEELYNLPNYSHVTISRSQRAGGGIRIYALNSLIINKMDEFSIICNSHEALFVKVSLPKMFSFIVGGIYRPPNCSVNEFNDYLSNTLFASEIIIRGKCILLGDFNINMMNLHVQQSHTEFCTVMEENGFIQIINSPTRCVRGIPCSLLDLIYINFGGNYESMVHDCLISDHLPISVNLNDKIDAKLIKCTFRDLSEENFARFNIDKAELFNSYNIVSNNMNDEFDKLDDWLNRLLERYFPRKVKYMSPKRLKMPWINKNILSLINTKHKLFKDLKRGILPYRIFYIYSKLLKVLLGELKNDYFKRKFNNYQRESKNIWKTINDVLNRSRKHKGIQQIILSDGSKTSDSSKMASEFNEYFNQIPYVTQSKLSLPKKDYLNLVPFNNETIFLLPTNSFEIESVIHSLKNKNNISMPMKFLKFVKSEISVVLSKLINICMLEGIYPDSLKIARIVPVFKTGNVEQISNYRPISLLPTINKIFEKLIYVRLQAFFDDCGIISDNQFGFRKSRDTVQATLKLIDSILPSMGSEEITAAIFLDFSKAFDTVEHELLLQKLSRYGVRGNVLKLLQSYLTNRGHCVGINDCTSSTLQLRVGVPQGSCLGPLLYLIYANDLNYLISDILLVLFADDTVLVDRNINVKLLIFMMNIYLDKISDWCSFNKLAINIDKTKWILFSNKKTDIPKLMINSDEIERVRKFKYLGFILDDRLTYRYHIKCLTSTMAKYRYITMKVRSYMTEESAKTFYYGLIHSLVCYGLLVWGGVFIEGASANRLCKLQDRIIFNLFSRDDDAGNDINAIYKRMNILKFSDLYRTKLCTCIFKILNENYAPFLLGSIEQYTRENHYEVRHLNDYDIPFPTVRSVKYNFLYRALKLWNDLTMDIKNLSCSKTFYTRLFNDCINAY